MRRALLTALAVLFVAAPAAEAAELSGRLVFCTGDDICRYFPEPRLEVAFVAAPGEANELRLTSHPDGVRVVDAGAAITTGTYCTPVSPNEAVCGPPAPSASSPPPSPATPRIRPSRTPGVSSWAAAATTAWPRGPASMAAGARIG